MKRGIFTTLPLILGVLVFAQKVGIGTSQPKAALDITSTNSGLLIPRLTTTQKNAIANPPKGLMVFDSSINQLAIYYNGAWNHLDPSGSEYWQTKNTGSEKMIQNNTTNYKRTQVGEREIQPTIGYTNSSNGAFTVWSRQSISSNYANFLTMDGKGIQARSQNITILAPQYDDNLTLNLYGGNVGIGTEPTHSRLEVKGTVGASAAMFGIGKAGVSIQADNPEIGFNYYYNNGTKTMKAGYAANIGMYPQTGDVYLGTFSGFTSPSDFGSIFDGGFQQVVTIKQSGLVGIGTTTPQAKLHVIHHETYGKGIQAVGKHYAYDEEIISGILVKIYDHQPAVHAIGEDQGSALLIDGPVSIPIGSKDFVFDVFPQTTNSTKLGYYFNLGSGIWAIKLTGSDSPLTNTTWPGQKHLLVTPYFVGSMADPNNYILPTQSSVFYSISDGQTYYVINQEPIQTGKPIFRLKVMVIRLNPSSNL